MINEVKLSEEDLRRIFKQDSSWRRASRTGWRVIKRVVGLTTLFFSFFLLINAPAYWQRLDFAVSRPKATSQLPLELPKEEPVVEYEPLIEIPKLGVSAPIIVDVEPEQIIERLKSGVVHYGQTALPGERGNSVLVGHSSDFPWSTGQYKTIFALLDKLAPGDQIIVAFGRQRLVYSVREIKTVRPTSVEVLRATLQPVLTLITCYPVGTTTNRLVVTAELTEGQITGEQLNEPAIAPLPQAR